MSKSKGNVMDPLLLMDQYGTDSLRFTMAAFAAQGRDIRLSEERIEGYRHFINKIWNAARFAMIHIKDCDPAITNGIDPSKLPVQHRWILSRLSRTTAEVQKALDGFNFNDVANVLYQFVWREFCDWYLEWSKADLYGDDAEAKANGQAVLLHVLESTLKLLHPVIPFVTEEIWEALPGRRTTIMTEPFPVCKPEWENDEIETAATLIMGVIGSIRNIRSEMQIHPSMEIEAVILCPDAQRASIIGAYESAIRAMSRTKKVAVSQSGERPEGAASNIYTDIEIFVPLAGLIDIDKETAKLAKEREKVEAQLKKVTGKLGNAKFMANAPDDIVAKEKGKESELSGQLAKIEENIQRLRELA